ncbi:MAG: rod shape-determining protein MreC [Thermodesulfobacteriota bacterium]
MYSLIKKHQLIITSVILCLLSIHLISINKRGTGGSTLVGSVVSFAAAPVQSAITNISKSIKETWYGYIYLLGLKEENDLLKNKIDILENEKHRLLEEVQATKRLKDLLGFKNKKQLSLVAAEIIGTDTYGWTKTFLIGKGLDEKLERNMAVVNPYGIVGKILEVQSDTSKVLLATDPRFRVDALIQRTRTKGIIEGNSSKRLILKYLRQLDDVKIGDKIISSGLGGIFPKGLVVGEVVKVEEGEDKFFKYIEVAPGTDLDRLEEVFVIADTN